MADDDKQQPKAPGFYHWNKSTLMPVEDTRVTRESYGEWVEGSNPSGPIIPWVKFKYLILLSDNYVKCYIRKKCGF